MRNYASHSTTMKITRKGNWLPVRVANVVAKLFVDGFESNRCLYSPLSDYFSGYGIHVDDLTDFLTSSECQVVASFVCWFRYQHSASLLSALKRAPNEKRICFTYVNLNTGFSLTFLDSGR